GYALSTEINLPSEDISLSMAQIEYFAHAIILPVVLSIGFVNQCINIATLLRLPPGGFVYLKASALSDILSIIFLIPFVIRLAGATDTQSESLMWYHAHLELTIANAFLGLSALCIVSMTIDRYLSVCHPIHFFNNIDSRSDRRSTRIVSFLCLVTFIVQAPTALQKEVKWNNETAEFEIVRGPAEQFMVFKMYIILRELITKIGPMIIIVLLNLLMVDTLKKMHKKNWRSSHQIRDRPQSERLRLSILLSVTSITFVICNFPATLLHIFIDKTEKDSVFWQTFRAAANILETSAYLFNFYLYALCSSDYREALIGLFICRPARSSRVNSPKKLTTFARQNESSVYSFLLWMHMKWSAMGSVYNFNGFRDSSLNPRVEEYLLCRFGFHYLP
ncbi:hypothetical protein PFISCL1PPCAC_24027, partial [Pristionchus fissidentatus]